MGHHPVIIVIVNVNPGLINPKRLFNWEGTIKKVSDEMTIGGVPPNFHK